MADVPMRVHKLTSDAVTGWSQVAGQIFVSDLIDEPTHPDAKMTVGFARLDKGETLDISFPYDEVLVITKGTYRVRTDTNETLTAGPGDVIYLPGGSSNSSQAEDDVEMVYVVSPPSVYAQHVAQASGE